MVANPKLSGRPLDSMACTYARSVNMNMDIQNKEKNPRNSFVPEDSLLMSKCDLRGANVINARNFLEAFER